MTMSSTSHACGCPEQRGLTRRGLLGRALAVGAGGALAGLVGDGLDTRLAFANPGYGGDVLVVLSLHGGFDGLSAVVPTGDPDYYKARPTIAVPRDRLLAVDGMFGLHPALAPLLPLWQGGQLAAVHAVGQPNVSRSHFTAMEELERAAPGTSIRTGWLDRMLGLTGATSPFAGVSVGGPNTSRLLAGPAPDLGLASIDGFTLSGESATNPMAAALRGLFAGAPPALAAPAGAAGAALGTTARLAATPYTPANGATYPDTSLGRALRDVARLVKGDVGLRAACVDVGDWDMHEGLGTAAPGQRMHDHLAEVARALAAFATDLGADGLARVTLVTVSEFGRRVAENGSRGVDHGYGNAMLLLGGGLRGGRVYGPWPGLAPHQLLAGDLKATTDYRAVIGEILRGRCGVDNVDAVFPGVAATSLGLVGPRPEVGSHRRPAGGGSRPTLTGATG
jgi:uncharacterized protein (DUF1501 family)